MSLQKLRIGVIGAGRMGITHQCILTAHPDVEIVGVADPSQVMTKMLGKYAGVRTYRDHRTMFDREALDAALLCTPPALNREIIGELAARQIHAFVEKPFVLSAEHGREVTRLFTEARLIGQVGYVNRFNRMFAHLRTLLAEGVIGRPLHFRSDMHSPTIIRPQPKEQGWRGDHAHGGGAMFEMASHAIDLALYLFGRPADVGGTRLTRVYSAGVEDIVAGNLLYADGLAGSLYINWSDPSYRKPTNKIEIFGERGRALADQHGMRLHLSEADPARGYQAGWNQISITSVAEPVAFYLRGFEFTAQLHDFVDHVRSGDVRTLCDFDDGTAVIEVIEAMFRDHARTSGGAAA